MKRLIMIRHAKSSWKYPDLSDFERPLNGRGRRDAPKMGARLAAAGVLPDLIVASPAKRALDTAAAISSELSMIQPVLEEPRVYEAGAWDLFEVIADLSDDLENVAIVGHNPGLTDLVNLLADAGIGNVPTAGVVRLELDVSSWQSVAPGRGRLVEFDWPKRED